MFHDHVTNSSLLTGETENVRPIREQSSFHPYHFRAENPAFPPENKAGFSAEPVTFQRPELSIIGFGLCSDWRNQ